MLERCRRLGRRDPLWLFLIPAAAALLTIAMAVSSALLLKVAPSAADFVIFGALSFVASAAVCGLFYAGLNAAGALSAFGTAAGLVVMCCVFSRPIELRGVVGLVSGAQTAFLFFLLGINIQMIQYLIKKLRRKGK